MALRRLLILAIIILSAVTAAAGELVLPVFALNIDGRNGEHWSSELYLTNPGVRPVEVTLSRFLPGSIEKPTPCDLFMPPTRVVPPQAAVVWTASGLATDLGCAESARGALVLRADGVVHIASRLVNLVEDSQDARTGVLSGRGEGFEAIPIERLPGPGVHLLPALTWHRDPCDEVFFDTFVGFANPGPDPVQVTVDLPHESQRLARINGRLENLPYSLEVAPESWRQIRLAPAPGDTETCGTAESFMARVEIDGHLALYASVVDRASGDPRTVTPVQLVRH